MRPASVPHPRHPLARGQPSHRRAGRRVELSPAPHRHRSRVSPIRPPLDRGCAPRPRPRVPPVSRPPPGPCRERRSLRTRTGFAYRARRRGRATSSPTVCFRV
jgi:hypothetical protein